MEAAQQPGEQPREEEEADQAAHPEDGDQPQVEAANALHDGAIEAHGQQQEAARHPRQQQRADGDGAPTTRIRLGLPICMTSGISAGRKWAIANPATSGAICHQRQSAGWRLTTRAEAATRPKKKPLSSSGWSSMSHTTRWATLTRLTAMPSSSGSRKGRLRWATRPAIPPRRQAPKALGPNCLMVWISSS